LPDGYYWVKTFINLRGGGQVSRWKIARVAGGRVLVLGLDAELDLGCPYLEHALWVRIEPTDGETVAHPGTAKTRRTRDVNSADAGEGRVTADRVRLVAEGVVVAFLAVHELAARYYDKHPEHRRELTEQIARLIERVQE
jgi:hypothetical protein